MPESLETAVSVCTSRVLDTAAFISVWPWTEHDRDLPAPDIAATMEFRGPCQGRMIFRVSSEVLPTLAMNMLGDFNSDPGHREKALDALKEVLNMICGNVLTAWRGAEAAFNLSPPEMMDMDMTPVSAPQAQAMFVFEGTRGEVEVYWGETVPPLRRAADPVSSVS
jgi:CheY-specific phosphatase CheX